MEIIIMDMYRQNKGFTLIELLVVIAILGVMSAVILGQLSSARSKGYDAQAKANFKNLANSGLLYYELNGNYNGICTDTSSATKFQTIYSAISGAVCTGAASGYRVKVQLRVPNQFNSSSGTDWLCTDPRGNLVILDTDPGTGSSNCP